ncbi:MAG TPA: hypothetical protein VLA13_08720, partial [Massilibacterium sp.]|nr:hypothetical protein [Massilibacterium sp.]
MEPYYKQLIPESLTLKEENKFRTQCSSDRKRRIRECAIRLSKLMAIHEEISDEDLVPEIQR